MDRLYLSYSLFKEEVISRNRYIYSNYTVEFLNAFKKLLIHHESTLGQEIVLYRAQKGNDWVELTDEDKRKPVPYTAERMIPLKYRAKEGRVNPKGLPCLYLGNDIDTCIMETRPWEEELVSIGYFGVKSDLKLINFANEKMENVNYLPEPIYETIDYLLWSDVNEAFSIPISNDDDSAQYVPTQILSELIKHAGYDGIIYDSKLGYGLNIALFNINNAEFLESKLFVVQELRCFGFEVT
ncbi:RES family NAD+ phosphorylase [Leptospira neocaledonica]|uniref:RES domain-containing protein n=1 Tax=Leptospira neocaledonica TaxID=2023192 RepID=A0A2M9ZTJ6_9LEPT|nr:RES family NAD+ phosphorylase [Leptospira neocaledonica]PJZ75279.1 hypothetical protein CH365_19700 [Leptospira neocaledonica]